MESGGESHTANQLMMTYSNGIVVLRGDDEVDFIAETLAMRCCFDDCPNYSPDADESELCSACNKEFALMYLTDTVEDIDRALESVDWRFCLSSLQEFDSNNAEVAKVKQLFEQLEVARNQLKERFIVTSAETAQLE